MREQLQFPCSISQDELGFAAITYNLIILVAYHDRGLVLMLHVHCRFSGGSVPGHHPQRPWLHHLGHHQLLRLGKNTPEHLTPEVKCFDPEVTCIPNAHNALACVVLPHAQLEEDQKRCRALGYDGVSQYAQKITLASVCQASHPVVSWKVRYPE